MARKVIDCRDQSSGKVSSKGSDDKMKHAAMNEGMMGDDEGDEFVGKDEGMEDELTDEGEEMRSSGQGMGCTLTLVGEEEEVVEAAVQHSIAVHGAQDNPELRDGIRGLMKDVDELPPEEASRVA